MHCSFDEPATVLQQYKTVSESKYTLRIYHALWSRRPPRFWCMHLGPFMGRVSPPSARGLCWTRIWALRQESVIMVRTDPQSMDYGLGW